MSESSQQRPTTASGPVPVYDESIAGALIDSARISVMAALRLLPEYSRIVLPGDDLEAPSTEECLDQAMQWLNAARGLSVEQSGLTPTSAHVVKGPR